MLLVASLFVALLLMALLALLPILEAAPSFAQLNGTLSSASSNPIAEQFVPNHVSRRVANLRNSVREYQDVATNLQSNAIQPQTGPLYAATPPWVKPPGQDEPRNWFPSRYGSNDEIGAANLLTPEVVRHAVGLVRQGKTYALGMEFNSKTPGYPPRHIDHYLLENIGSDHANLDDIITGWLNVGTQIDGLAHMGIGGMFYNGNKSADIVDAHGLKKLGIEKVPPLVTRGVLLDLASYKGVRTLQGGQVITVADLEGACRQQGVQIERGDVVLLHTGWMEAMSSDTLRYYNSQPGPGRSGAEYLAAKGIVALGSDTPRVDVVPFETPQEFFPVHQTLLAKNGIYLLESINTSVLARDGVHEFLFVLGQPRFTGASQSIINPVAIR
jgi:kynurenine formamidase